MSRWRTFVDDFRRHASYLRFGPAPLTVTETIRKGMDLLEEKYPDHDPGDVTISIQDDMPLVILSIPYTVGSTRLLTPQFTGRSVEEAAEQYLRWCKKVTR